MRGFKILSHTADIGIEVTGKTLEELFENAAYGWKHLVIENSATFGKEEKNIQLQSADLDDLMVLWLNELNFLLTTRFWVMHEVEFIEIIKENDHWELEAILNGEEFDESRHKIHFEIKAVTYHQLHIHWSDESFRTKIIFDI